MAVVSDQSEPLSDCQGFVDLGGKWPPFGQGDFPAFLEPVSIVDVTLEIEVVVACGACSGSAARTRK